MSTLHQPAISVALCTYNGGAYLPQQLQSLAQQTVLPNELVVFDDGSTDQTVEILRGFARENPGFEVRIEVNDSTVGPAANFQRAIRACRGEIIALCDQDDVWMADKVQAIGAEFAGNPELGLVFSDAEICDQGQQSLGYCLWQSVGLVGNLRRKLDGGRAFEVILRQNVVTGATMAFAARFRDLVLPIDPLWMHDGWIALLIAAVAPVSAIPRPLVRYRQHAAQAIGALRRSLYQQYLNAKKMDGPWFGRQADLYEAALGRVSQRGAARPGTIELLEQKVRHFRRRSAIHRRGVTRILPSMIELVTLRYRRFSLGWKSFAQDLFL